MEKEIDIPCLDVKLVSRDKIVANNYNPNSVPRDKLDLLKTSIRDNGLCYPLVVIWDSDDDKYVIIDGYHRYLLCQKQHLNIKNIPVIVLKHDITKRMFATIQFNKARGVHQVDLDAELIRALIEQGMDEEGISEHLGIDIETIHRYKQLTGVAEIFKGVEYSMSWGMVEDEEGE